MWTRIGLVLVAYPLKWSLEHSGSVFGSNTAILLTHNLVCGKELRFQQNGFVKEMSAFEPFCKIGMIYGKGLELDRAKLWTKIDRRQKQI